MLDDIKRAMCIDFTETRGGINFYMNQRENGMRQVLDYLGLDARKPVFGCLQTTQAQTSLRIRAV